MALVLEEFLNSLYQLEIICLTRNDLASAEEPSLNQWNSTEQKSASLLNYMVDFCRYPELFLEVFHSQWTRPKLAYLRRLPSKFLWFQL